MWWIPKLPLPLLPVSDPVHVPVPASVHVPVPVPAYRSSSHFISCSPSRPVPVPVPVLPLFSDLLPRFLFRSVPVPITVPVPVRSFPPLRSCDPSVQNRAETLGLTNGAFGCPQAHLLACSDGGACGTKGPAVNQN